MSDLSRLERIMSGDESVEPLSRIEVEMQKIIEGGSGQSEQTAEEIAAINKKILGTFKDKGSRKFSNLPTNITTDMVGWTYNITDSFTTDDRFVEGYGKKVDAGTDVSIVYDPEDATKVKFNLFNVASEPEAIPLEDLVKMWEDN